MPHKRYVLTGSDCCDRVLPVLGRHAARIERQSSRQSLLSYKASYGSSPSIREGEINSSRRTASMNPRL